MKPDPGLSVEVETADGRVYSWKPSARVSDRPIDIQFSTQRGDGFTTASVSLARRVIEDFPDLNLCDTFRFIGFDGTVAYEGRHEANPRSVTSDGHRISVELVGWMTHAKDRKFADIYVDRLPANWGDAPIQRRDTHATADRPYGTDFTVEQRGQGVAFEAQQGKAVKIGSGVEVWDAAPEGATFGRFQYRGTQQNAGDVTNPSLDATDSRTGNPSTTSTLTLDDTVREVVLSSGTRYLYLRAACSTAFTKTTVFSRRFSRLAVYGSQGIPLRDSEPGEPQGVDASDVIRDSCTRYAPKLDPSGVLDTGYTTLQAAWPDPVFPYDAWVELNEIILWELAVWENRKLTFGPIRRDDFDWQVSLGEMGLTGTLSGDVASEVRSGLMVTYEDLLLGPRILSPNNYADLRDPDSENPASEHGEDRWGEEFAIPYPTTQAIALRVGALKLQQANEPKAPASFQIGPHVRDSAGNWQPSWKVRANDRVRITDLPYAGPRLIVDTQWNRSGLTVNCERPSIRVDAILARAQKARESRGS